MKSSGPNPWGRCAGGSRTSQVKAVRCGLVVGFCWDDWGNSGNSGNSQFGQSGQFELDRTGFAIRGDMQIGKEVMPVLTGLEIRKLQALAIGGQD